MSERRHKVWVDSRIQWPFTRLIMVSTTFCAVLGAVLGFAWGSLAASRAFGVDNMWVTFSWLLSPHVTMVLLPLILIAACIAAFVWVGVHASHRIAGPVVPISRALARAREGDYSQPIKLRRGDWLVEHAGDLNRTLAAVRAREERLEKRIRELSVSHAPTGTPGDSVEIAQILEASIA